MNTFEGKFTDEEKDALNVMFEGFHFKQVGRKGVDEFYYADKRENNEQIHMSARNLLTLTRHMIILGFEK